MTTHLKLIKLLYYTRLFTQFGIPKGSTEREVFEFERKLGKRLPSAYREFLLWMGDDKHGRLRGSEWFLSDVATNTASLRDLMLENDLPVDNISQPLCFFMHQGYMAAWFDLDSTAEDPECFHFSEGSKSVVIEGSVKFTEFLKIDLGL